MLSHMRGSILGRLLCLLSVGLMPAQEPVTGKAPASVLTDTAPPPTSRFPARWYPPTTERVYTQSVQLGLPYTAILVTTGKAEDPKTGKITTFATSTRQLRDTQGRRRDEQEMPRPDNGGRTVLTHEVSVHDPVSHCDFRWLEPWVVVGSAQGQPWRR